MQLPKELQWAIDRLFEKVSLASLRKTREALTHLYQEQGRSRFSDQEILLAYLGARLPATYAAAHKALQKVSLQGHLLDLGAGPGTASWAAADLFPGLEKITLIEPHQEAIALGKILAQNHPFLSRAVWMQQTLSDPLPRADAAILSYALGELPDPERAIAQCWDAVSTLILVEPGTPKGFQRINKAREQLIDLKGHLIAPCPHAQRCPMQEGDWCHFSARLERSRTHRLLKGGSLGYEDEKFCYLIAAKSKGPPFSHRLLRHPVKQEGHMRLKLCTDRGSVEEKIFSRKDRALYRQARKSEWGDIFTQM